MTAFMTNFAGLCYRHRWRSAVLLVVGLASACWADPSLPHLFSDHMVLQEGREIRIWGNADPEEKIQVILASKSITGVADALGHWTATLAPMSAGGPFTVRVIGKKEIVLRDVMIGEVWIASGQSNMAFALSNAAGADLEIPKADYPQIRWFMVPRKIALSPQSDTLAASWQICTPDNAKRFSAVAYFFSRELHRRLNVPVGIIQSAWPGSTIEEWIDSRYFHGDAELETLLAEWESASPAVKTFAEKPLDFDLEFDDFELVPSRQGGSSAVSFSNFDDGTSRNAGGGVWFYDWQSAPDTGFELTSPGRGNAGFAAHIHGYLDGSQTSTLTARYKLDGSTVDLSAIAGIRFWVRGHGTFRLRSLQPTITDYDDYATSVLKATAGWQQVTVWFPELGQEGWGVNLPFTPNALTGFSIENLTSLEYAPLPISGLYEGMITPLQSYASRGVIWYQGESNALRAHQYRKLLPALIENWRRASQQEDLEFLIVQLPNHGAIPEQPSESAWAELREAQLQTMKQTAHTGMAVTIDVGESKDVHPHCKLEVGQRLAWWALGTTYQQSLVYSGPLYDSMKVEVNQAVVRFTQLGSGLEARGAGPLQGFAIAGADRKFHWATARIQGDRVIVSSPGVPTPVAVRYAWADSPPCNLFNRDGLPASPFRTDDWPGITGGR